MKERETESTYADRRQSAVTARRGEVRLGRTERTCGKRRAIRDGGLQRRTLEYEGDRGRGAKPTLFGIGSGAERSEGLRDGDLAGVERPATVASNVKHQRARATVSRVKDELSLRALRCMR